MAVDAPGDLRTDSDALVILRSLRTAGDEVQLTRLMGELAQRDQTFALGLLRTLVNAAPHGARVAGRVRSDGRVRTWIEKPMRHRDEALGRVDLVLEGGEITLFVEVKLHSDYGVEQLGRYLRGIDADRGEFLVSVTRNVSRFREPDASAPAWLGSVRWARLARSLADLPAGGPLRDQWNLLLRVLEEDGDLGSTELTSDLVTAYEKSDAAYERLTGFLEQMGVEILESLRGELRKASPDHRLTASFTTKSRSRKKRGSKREQELDVDYPQVLAEGEQLYLPISIPADGPERAWVGFYVEEGKAALYVAAGWSEHRDPPVAWEAGWRTATTRLEGELGHEHFFVDDDQPYVQVDFPLKDFVELDDAPEAMAGRAREVLLRFVQAGLFASDAPLARRYA